MSQDSFVHLDVKSDFTFWRGASKIGDLVSRASELGMPALALADFNNLFGSFDFSKKAADKGVQPIVGAELAIGYSGVDARGLKTTRKGTVIALAQDDAGYTNLCTLIAKATKPKDDVTIQGVLSARDLMDHTDGMILLSGGRDGILYTMLKDGLEKEALQMAGFLQGLMKGRFYIQISRHRRHPLKEEHDIERKLLQIAYSDALGFEQGAGGRFSGAPLIATSPVRYATEDRHQAWEMLRAIQSRGQLHYRDGEILSATTERFHMRSADEMRKLFKDLPEAFENAQRLAQRSAFKVEQRKPILPPFDGGAGRSEVEELRHQSEKGLAVRLEKEGVSDPEEVARYKERLDYELGVIENMGFPGYFLIVSDFIKWARQNSIPVGPGRGSGAGSVVAWALTITDLNPFRFGLLFERFLNPDRVSMPDFDIDFCQDRREDVIRYVGDKYGLEHVAQISNFGEIKSKTAIKDAARIIMDDVEGSFAFHEVNEITQMIPRKEDSAEPKSLKDAYESTPQLRDLIDGSAKMRLLYREAHQLEGLYRSQGMHAAGVVIADRPLYELAPLGWDDESGLPVTQFNMKAAESVGLVKFDFLGLKTLSVIRRAVDLIKEFQGTEIDIEAVPMDDPEVFEMLADGKSIGVFQFESAPMQGVLRQVVPTRVEDLIAVNALYRPGPMEMIPDYAACKRGQKEPHYPDPIDKTKPFLEETFGIMVYQEQVMQVAQVVAGYSLGQADILRRAMGKKIKSEMDAQKEMFIKGATERGTSPEAAADLFHHIEKFASYGFNKSHAAAYAVIAYRTAWLKRHYPVEFFSALMSYESDNPDKMTLIRDDMANHPGGKVELLMPDINRSKAAFMPEKGEQGGYAIRFGLSAIKGISGALLELSAEQDKAPFSDLIDFHMRAGHRFNKTQLEKLVEAGAFDGLEQVRAKASSVLSWLSRHWKPNEKQNDLFADSALTVPEKVVEGIVEWGDISDREFRAVGFWFGKHPLDAYMNRLKRSRKVSRKESYLNHMSNKGIANLNNQHLCGLVEDARIRESRKGNSYIMVKLSEKDDSYTCFFFTNRNVDIYDIYDQLAAAQRARKPVVIRANLALEEDDLRIFANEVIDVDEFLKNVRGTMQVILDAQDIILTNEEFDLVNQASDENEKSQIYARAMHRKVKEIAQVLDNIRDDENDGAVKLVLEVNVPGYNRDIRNIKGRYLFTPAAENGLKSMDGVRSIREIEGAVQQPKKKPKPVAKPASPPASPVMTPWM